MSRIDLNADVGEAPGDLEVLAFVSSANIACGVHAGDEDSMRRAVAEARKHGLAVGAHPGYPDREHMGRRPMDLPPAEVRALVREQVRTLAAIAGDLSHVKPHGALYNQAAADRALADAVTAGVADVSGALTLVGLAGGAMSSAAADAGLAFAAEAFADRGYRSDGTLAPRGTPGALITDPAAAAARAVAIARGEPVDTVAGGRIALRADTICIHGDTPGAAEAAKAIRGALLSAGVRIATPTP